MKPGDLVRISRPTTLFMGMIDTQYATRSVGILGAQEVALVVASYPDGTDHDVLVLSSAGALGWADIRQFTHVGPGDAR